MEKKELWDQVLIDVKKNTNVTQTTCDNFFRPIVVREISEQPKIVYLTADADLIVRAVKQRYYKMIEGSIKRITGDEYKVIVKSTSDYSEDRVVSKPENRSRAFDANISFKKEKIFNPKYTFDNFVVGESNKYANASCIAVAKNPSEAFNPLFIYGKSGLGKTHLMNAIGIYMLDHNSDINILYVSSETFTNDFIKAIQDNKTREFKNKYRRADVLLIDDIQFIEGKESTQEEFFHTFNALYEENKQIIISGDRPPSKLNALDERLRSRFGWNLIAEIQSPDYETRVAILLKKAENMGVNVDEDMHSVICLISEKIKDNIRELEGAFSRVISFSKFMDEPVDVAFAKSVLKDIMVGCSTVTPEKIKSTICKHYKIKVTELDSETRKATIAYPRQIAMYLCRTLTDYSLPRIGKIFGNKHYSTVKHACDKIYEEQASNKELKEELETLKALIES